jgi:multidrug resistance efflux pump
LLIAGAAGLAWTWNSANDRAPDALVLPGVVEVQEVRLGSKVGGRVREVHILEGDLVGPGVPLVTLDVPELEAQRSQWQAKLRSDLATLAKARNGPRREEIDAAVAEVAAAEARSTRMKQGFREEEVLQAKSDWLSAEADLKLAEENLGRYERLLQRGSVTQSQVDSARADYDRARGRAAAARAHFDLLFKGNRPEDVAEAAALLDQARANLDLLKAGTRAEDIETLEAQVDLTRARLKEAEANCAEAVVHSPGKAVVDVVSVRKGDLVSPGQPVVRILKADDLWVKVFIPETDLGRVRLDQAVTVTVDSYPGTRFPGRVVQIATQSEFTPRNIQSIDERRHQVFAAKVRVDNPQGVFKSGMAAEVAIPVERRVLTGENAEERMKIGGRGASTASP